MFAFLSWEYPVRKSRSNLLHNIVPYMSIYFPFLSLSPTARECNVFRSVCYSVHMVRGYDVTSSLVPCSFQGGLLFDPVFLPGGSSARGSPLGGVGNPLLLTSSGSYCSDRFACTHPTGMHYCLFIYSAWAFASHCNCNFHYCRLHSWHAGPWIESLL